METESRSGGGAADEGDFRRAEADAAAPAPGASPAPQPGPLSTAWELLAAAGVWLASVLAVIFVPLVILVVYGVLFDRRGLQALFEGRQFTQGTALVSLAGTFVAHVLTMLLCWLVVTRAGRRPFLASLDWRWHPQFKWVHAIGLAFLMLLIGGVLEKTLPHRETDLAQLLRISASVRVAVALLATFGAPFVEEIVYRGILYSALERAAGRWVGVGLVTLLFALVHVPQYRQSVATVVAILALSVVLTALRAATGRLLPCVATHFVFNGIRSLIIIFAPPAAPTPPPEPQVAALIAWLW
jgi:uncharacterized protein